MESHAIFQICSVKVEDDPLSNFEAKTEPGDFINEIKTESEECNQPETEFHAVELEQIHIKPEIQTLSLLIEEDCEKMSENQLKTTPQDVLPVVYESREVHNSFNGEKSDYISDETKWKAYISKLCNSSFSNHHSRMQATEKLFQCNVCSKSYCHKTTLNAHMHIHTGQLLKCTICGKSFSFKYDLKVHMRSHTGFKPFICNDCGKSFCKKFNLNVHMRTHSGLKTSDKLFQCNVCSKSYCHKTTLVAHMHTHTEHELLTCTICGKSCSFKYDLKVHMLTHTGQKPYVCNICGKSFCKKSNLIVHMRIHTNVKNFTCNTCGKSFSDKSDYTKHLHTHIQQV